MFNHKRRFIPLFFLSIFFLLGNLGKINIAHSEEATPSGAATYQSMRDAATSTEVELTSCDKVRQTERQVKPTDGDAQPGMKKEEAREIEQRIGGSHAQP